MNDLAIAAVAVVVLGGAYVLGKRKAPTPPGPGEDPLLAACKAAGVPELACRAGKGLLGGLVNVVQSATTSRETTNVRLNGPVVERVDVGANRGSSDAHGTTYRALVGLSPGVRHQNGCVPIPGHSDWAKCAAGTRHIIDNGNLESPTQFGGNTWWARFGVSRGYLPTRTLSGDPAHDALTFQPSPQTDPQTWYVRGKRTTCPAGTTVNPGRDHRTGAPACSTPAREVSPPPPIVPPTSGPIIPGDGNTRDRRTS